MDMTTCSRSRYLQSLVLKPSLNTTLPVPFANTFTPRLTTMRWGTPRGASINYAVYGGLFLESSKSYKRDPLPPKCIWAVTLYVHCTVQLPDPGLAPCNVCTDRS